MIKHVSAKLFKSLTNLALLEIFQCSHKSLKRWVERYIKSGSLKNKERKEGSYKLKKKHVEYMKEIIKKYPDLFLHQIHNKLKENLMIILFHGNIYMILLRIII
jgi:transposase